MKAPREQAAQSDFQRHTVSSISKPSTLVQLSYLLSLAPSNIWRAKWSSLTVLLCILLLEIVYFGFTALSRGFDVAKYSAGADDVLVVLCSRSGLMAQD